MNIDWSNPTIQGIVVAGAFAVAGGAIAALAGYFGAKAGAKIGADAARESARITQLEAQNDRAETRRSFEIDRRDARLDRFADRKLSLVVDLLLAADLHAEQSRVLVAEQAERSFFANEFGAEENPPPLPVVGSVQPVRNAYQAIDLVAPAIAEAASDVYKAVLPLGTMAASWPVPEAEYGVPSPRWDDEWQKAEERWYEARHAFVDAVREDLGVNPDQSLPSAPV